MLDIHAVDDMLVFKNHREIGIDPAGDGRLAHGGRLLHRRAKLFLHGGMLVPCLGKSAAWTTLASSIALSNNQFFMSRSGDYVIFSAILES